MQHRLDELAVRVAVVTFEDDLFARAYAQETQTPWPILVDTDRRLYRAFGMLSAGLFDVWNPKTLAAYATEMAAGQRLASSSGDTRQRGGNVLVDPTGTVEFVHVGSGPADRPDPLTLIDIVQRAG